MDNKNNWIKKKIMIAKRNFVSFLKEKRNNFISNKLTNVFIVLVFFMNIPFIFSQDPMLEFAAGDGNPTGNGPVLSTSIRMRMNANNPNDNVFTTYRLKNFQLNTIIYHQNCFYFLKISGTTNLIVTSNQTNFLRELLLLGDNPSQGSYDNTTILNQYNIKIKNCTTI